MDISVVGAAAVWDYLSPVDTLPENGGIVKVLEACPAPYLGGCAPNIATGLKQLGASHVLLHYPIGKDAAKKKVLESWENTGVDCTAVQVAETGYSGAAWQYMQPDGATMCFAYAGVADTALPNAKAPLGDWVVITPVLNQFTFPLLEKALAENKRVITTGICNKRLLAHLPKLYALMVNHYEAQQICTALGKPSIQSLAEVLGETILYVTLGTKGSLVLYGGKVYEIPVIAPCCTKDVTGAGDSFTAGVVFGLQHDAHPANAAYIGACCASFVIEEYGGQSHQASWPGAKQRLMQQQPSIANKLVF